MKTKTARVLVVDDDPDFLHFAKTVLESRSYNVVAAPGEIEALFELAAEKPDLFILDVMMSSLDAGFQLLWKLKADKRYRDIPVLMATAVDKEMNLSFAGHADPSRRSPDVEPYLPVEAYLVKPVKAVDLLNAVERALDRAAALSRQEAFAFDGRG